MRPLLLFVAASLCGIAQTEASLTFEVATVKKYGDPQPAGPVGARKSEAAPVRSSGADPILFSRRNATLASLIQAAYHLKAQQVIGPDWLTTERYEVVARISERATAEQQMIMLKNLLTERFQIKLHRETRDLPIFEMVVAKGGSKLKEPAQGADALPELRIGGPMRLSVKDGANWVVLREQGTLSGLAERLSAVAGRPILDRTGLKGNYDFALNWAPPARPDPADASAPADPAVNLAAALESQLGLKLEAKKAPLEVLVIDHAEKNPADN
jgi:uncharacterized protein (TIGR03435 family)